LISKPEDVVQIPGYREDPLSKNRTHLLRHHLVEAVADQLDCAELSGIAELMKDLSANEEGEQARKEALELRGALSEEEATALEERARDLRKSW